MHVLFVPDGRQALGLLIDDGNPGRFPDAPDAEKQKEKLKNGHASSM